MLRLLRHPLVRFVILGAVLGGAVRLVSDRAAPSEATTIRVTADDVARLRAEWTARWSRPPTSGELEAVVRASVRERVLYREAIRLGLDRDDPIVRRALGQKLERIASDLIELGLAPTDQDLGEYFAENAESYRPEPVVTFTQVFVDATGEAAADAEQRAGDLVAQLAPLGEAAAERAESFGDRLMLPHRLTGATPRRVGAQFGTGFADSVFALEPGDWQGPVRSGYGLHAVYVHALETFPIPELAEVRDRVRQDWADQTRRETAERYYDELLARYEVIVETGGSEASEVRMGAPGS
jgi:parvulin-like peptidyl-prolyl isomerase